ncbi:iron-siderophore ABC transporter substrate-binding protein [Pseudonocardia sp. ICBG601]|uniref:iron-siderophore ABC transporter substrate-binding protein n=1 Tax=Pseudonocardia sp. ICBG601 TaxID=2846759 RepID=UPI001CF7037B|nr:iron-siderophore ABC transporter substrate-binding protein [Pseudonocardia sp. ICBG601]
MSLTFPGRAVRRAVRRAGRPVLPRAVAAAVCLFLLAGCGAGATRTPAPAGTDGAAPTALPAGQGSPEPDGVFPRTVTHETGTTTIPAEPRRVVVISTGQLDGLLSLGVVPVGSTRAEAATMVPEYLTTAFPRHRAALAAMADLGLRTDPAIEAVAAARPDLILANVAGAQEVASRLSAIAPTVMTRGNGVNWKTDLLLIGHALGRAGAAQALVDDLAGRARAVGEQAGPVEVSLLRIQPTRVRVFGIGSFPGSLLADAGITRPPSQRFPATSEDLSAEELGRADAGWIFYGVQGAAPDAPPPALLTEGIGASLGAVRDRHTTAVDDDTWFLNAGPQAARVVLDDLAAALGTG